MFRIGLSSSALLRRPPEEVVALARKAGFDGIEWAGVPHLPPGDAGIARDVMMATLRAGLTIAAYAPLYRVLPGGGSGISFPSILETAREINAPLIRVYAGGGLDAARKSASAKDGPARVAILDELRRLGDLAGSKGIAVALSPGQNTWMDSWREALCLADEASHPFIHLAWEPIPDDRSDSGAAALEEDPGAFLVLRAREVDRAGALRPLAGAGARWSRILRAFAAKPGPSDIGCFVLLGGIGDPGEEGMAALASDLAFARGIAAAPAG